VVIAANVLADTSTGPGMKSLIDFVMFASKFGEARSLRKRTSRSLREATLCRSRFAFHVHFDPSWFLD